MIGNAIKEYIDSNGIKQAYISQKTGIKANTLNAILNEKRKILAEEYFIICEALGVSVDKFSKSA